MADPVWSSAGMHELIKYQIAAQELSGVRSTTGCSVIEPGAALYGPARVSYSPDGQLLAMAARPEGVRIARAARWGRARLAADRLLR